MGRKFPKSVSFNTNNPNDQRILEHVKRRNFSGYVKRLILDDIALTPAQRPQSKLERLLNGSDDISKEANGSADSKSD